MKTMVGELITFLISKDLHIENINQSICNNIKGSDHCPLVLDLDY